MPGEAWLEFKIDTRANIPLLIQKATFRPKGLLGRLYWSLLKPFHFVIFRKLIRSLINTNHD